LYDEVESSCKSWVFNLSLSFELISGEEKLSTGLKIPSILERIWESCDIAACSFTTRKTEAGRARLRGSKNDLSSNTYTSLSLYWQADARFKRVVTVFVGMGILER